MFDELLLISNSDFDKHSVKVKLVQSALFMTKSGSPLDPDNQVLLSSLPLQYEEGGAVAKLAGAVDMVRSAST